MTRQFLGKAIFCLGARGRARNKLTVNLNMHHINTAKKASHILILSTSVIFTTIKKVWLYPHVVYMGGFAQFGLNQKCCSQLQLSLDTDKLKSCNFVCSSITAMQGFAKVICRDCDHCKCPKMHLKH